MTAVTRGIEFWIDARDADAGAIGGTLRSIRRQSGAPTRTVGGPGWRGFDSELAETSARYLVWIDAGAELEPHAVGRIESVIERFVPELIYGDDIQTIGGRREIIHRPDFSPERLLTQDYLGEVRVFETDALRGAGGFHDLPPGLVTWEAVLRLTPKEAVHIPESIARRRRTDRRIRPEAAREMVLEELARREVAGEVESVGSGLRIRYRIDAEPLVSIVIPTRGSSAVIDGKRVELVTEAVRGIIERSTYRRFEIVIVADAATPQTVVHHLIEIGGDALVVVPWSAPFNFAAKVNRGVAVASGDHVLLLNDDVEVISPDWIEAMLGLVQQPGIGMAGAALFFEDGSIQHGGHFYETEAAGHIAFEWDRSEDDLLESMSVVREASGVTAACALISRELYLRAGGLSALFPSNYNDVDFSLKVRSLGERIVWTPYARLFHYESKTREPTLAAIEIETLRSRWRSRIQVDGYWPSGTDRYGLGPRPVRSLSDSSNGASHPAR